MTLPLSEPFWYVVQVRSGYEEKALLSIKEKLAKKLLSDNLIESIIPKENVCKIVNGHKKLSKKVLYPGYIMLSLIITNEVHNLISDAKYVISLMKKKISEDEMLIVKKNVESGKKIKKISASYEILENVKIISGPFENFFGYVDEVDIKSNKVKVIVNIFGRDTPVSLSFSQLEKVN